MTDKCLNTYGSCQNPTVPLEYPCGGRILITNNFCSDTCRKSYSGNIKSKRRSGNKKSFYRHPLKKDWIVEISNHGAPKQIFIWDSISCRYYQYHLGIGLVDDLDNVIANEDSPLYKSIIESLDKNTRRKILYPKPIKLPHKSLNKPIKLPKNYKICNNCGQLLKFADIKLIPDMLICPNCDWNIYKSKKEVERLLNKPKKGLPIRI